MFFALKSFFDNNSNAAPNSSIVINCPEADNVIILLLEHQLLKNLINSYNIHLYCAVHEKLVDVKTGKPTKKPKESANVEEFCSLSSKIKMNLYIDVDCPYANLSSSDCFANTAHAIESLGVLSIYTGNDKNPGLRHITKPLALTVNADACKDGILFSLVDCNGNLSNTQACKTAFLLLCARIYFHMYRVYIRKLPNISWETIADNEIPNFKILREIGYQYAKGQLHKVPPVDGAFDEIFARALFQANEYDQIFKTTIHYLNPLDFGFEAHKNGLRPRLNRYMASSPALGTQIVMSEVNTKLLCSEARIDENIDLDCMGIGNVDVSASGIDCDETASIFKDAAINMTAENIFDITLGQVDWDFLNEMDLSHDKETLDEDVQVPLFTFE